MDSSSQSLFDEVAASLHSTPVAGVIVGGWELARSAPDHDLFRLRVTVFAYGIRSELCRFGLTASKVQA